MASLLFIWICQKKAVILHAYRANKSKTENGKVYNAQGALVNTPE